jgi:uncharacterized protein DUF6894
MIVAFCSPKGGSMPIFYINFQSGDEISKDDEGQDLPGLEEARTAALVAAREILADNVKGDAKNPLQAVIITNKHGQELMRIPAKEVLPEPLK